MNGSRGGLIEHSTAARSVENSVVTPMYVMRNWTAILVIALVSWSGCASPDSSELVVYSGRSKELVEPVINAFSEETGIQVSVRYGDTAELAVALLEEGAQSQADLFWAQDAGALGAVDAAGLLAPLSDSVLQMVPSAFRSDAGHWVGVTGRARTLAYATERVDVLPTSVFELTDAAFAGRVGWAPSNGSFQAFVTAMRLMEGNEVALQWLIDMKENGAVSFPKNSAIVQGIADGVVDYGLPNHYYLYRFTSQDSLFPVRQTYFAAGDPGVLVNVAGIGKLSSGSHPGSEAFIRYMLAPAAQEYFATATFEYPVVEGIATLPELLPVDSLARLQPPVDLDGLGDLEETLALLREAGVL